MSAESDIKTIAQVALLAPGAGAGIGKVLAESLTSDPELLPLMVEAAKGGLAATRSFWVKSGKGGHLETEPDMRVRVQTLFGLLAHMEGEPVKRIIHQHMSEGKVDPLAVLKDSPAAREAMQRLLDKANWKEQGGDPARARRERQAAEVAVEV